MDMRESKGIIIAATCKLRRNEDGTWRVPSQTQSAERERVYYTVDLTAKKCTCPDCVERGVVCKHQIAARIVYERETDRDGNLIETKTVTLVEKKSYHDRDWKAYEKAQHEEKWRFQVLLADLCRGVVDLPHEGVGRKPVPLADRLFSIIYKTYSTVSSRRFNCDLQEAHQDGFLSRPLHPAKLRAFSAEEDLTPYLKAMIVRSSLPLKSVETDFAVDSTGFSVSKYVKWFDEKYGVTRSGHDWVKVHVVCGTTTGITTAAAIYGRDTGDSPILPELVKQTRENFAISEVSADKAYLSVENVETVFAAGGIPFIAPKVNSTGAVGGLFEKMIRYYQYKQDEFLQHYHRRSLVESLFSAVKRKFGHSIKARTPVAMVNETYSKFICNNLCAVILSQIELGVEAEFWPKSDDAAVILPISKA